MASEKSRRFELSAFLLLAACGQRPAPFTSSPSATAAASFGPSPSSPAVASAQLPSFTKGTCSIVKVLGDGAVLLRVGGSEREMELEGISLPTPPSADLVDVLTVRLARQRAECTVRSELPNGRAVVAVRYFAWRDKSGDVWEDLSETLLRLGLARVAPR
jgi:hypothetical protein